MQAQAPGEDILRVGQRIASLGFRPHPERALSDGYQSLYPEQFCEVAEQCRAIAQLLANRKSGAGRLPR